MPTKKPLKKSVKAKAPSKKVVAKKPVASKKATPKKATPKKATPKKESAKKTSTKKITPKKTKATVKYEESQFLASIKPYALKKNEKYMNAKQKQHFLDILGSWKHQLQIEQDRTADKIQKNVSK